jgi:hypothetical protein
MAAAVFLPPSPHPHPRLGQRVLVSSINSRLAKHFTRFQRAAARSCSTSSSTSSSNRTPQYTTYLWISMILSTDARTLYAAPPVVAANALPDKFVICMRPCTRAHYAHIRARVIISTQVSHPPNGCCSSHSRRRTCSCCCVKGFCSEFCRCSKTTPSNNTEPFSSSGGQTHKVLHARGRVARNHRLNCIRHSRRN